MDLKEDRVYCVFVTQYSNTPWPRPGLQKESLVSPASRQGGPTLQYLVTHAIYQT
jgi:hypothetical protein